MTRVSRRQTLAVVTALLLGGPLAAGSVEVFGRPLRGLSAVSIAALKREPARYRDKTVRVSGTVRSGGGKGVVLEDGETVAIATDGTFDLPANLGGARLVAEGRVTAEGSLVASGAEVTR